MVCLGESHTGAGTVACDGATRKESWGSTMDVEALDYALPEALIAQRPAEQRDAARLLVVERARGTFHEARFRDLPSLLRAGDCVVFNDTRVIRARLLGKKATGGRVELFLLHEEGPGAWRALVRPSAKAPPGTTVHLPGGEAAEVGERLPEGQRMVRFARPDVLKLLEEAGALPLPPYIRREQPDPTDLRRYQTVFASADGAVAAPTAGLHYTPEVLAALDAAGVFRAQLTLHVGYGTFKPIQARELSAHRVDPEEYVLPEAAATRLNAVRASGGRVVAAGTTVTRALETQYDGMYRAGAGLTEKYIYPPYEFRAVDALQTNFHLPRSSLLALVCAFAGRDLVMEAYRHAVAARFRFYSYGDTMLIL